MNPTSVFTEHPNRVDKLVTLLEESKRASKTSTNYFVEPAPDTLRKTTTRRHHLIFGRRGSGKTSLLRKAEADLIEVACPVAFLDMDKNKRLSFADLLIASTRSILKDFRKVLERAPDLDPELLKKFKLAETELETLYRQPDEVETREQAGHGQESESNVTGIAGGFLWGVSLGTKAKRASLEKELSKISMNYNSRKVDEVNRLALFYSELLKEMTEEIDQEAFVMIDDLYHLRLEDQARLLDFIHGLVKDTNVWMKICTVRNRSIWYFQEGDQPVGLKPGDDADEIVLDRPLEYFTETKQFLINVLTQFIEEAELEPDDFMSEVSQDRLVRASGGVIRDFLNIFAESIRMTKQRISQASLEGRKTSPKVGANDIYEAVEFLSKSKWEEVWSDVHGEETKAVGDMVNSMKDHCFGNQFPFFLVEIGQDSELEGSIETLTDLKLVHCINRRVNVKNRSYKAYMIDLGLHVAQRNQRKIDTTTELPEAQKIISSGAVKYVFGGVTEAA